MQTTKLWNILHTHYFRIIAVIIASRAEVVALERSLMSLNSELQVNSEEERRKTNAMARLWQSHTRTQRMRLRRSELGKLIFGKSQRHVLEAVFTGWIKFWTWRLGVRAQYNLKYKLVKHEMDLNQASQRIEDAQRRKLHGYATKAKGQTILKRHQGRLITCRMCGKDYIEAQNHARACSYHPGKYEVACPRSCEFAMKGQVSNRCMSHRVKRWTCCDERQEGEHGNNGCCARFHLPPLADPKYEVAIADVEARDKMEDEFLKTESDRIRRDDWENKHRKRGFDQLQEMEADLAAERQIVQRYKFLPKPVADTGKS